MYAYLYKAIMRCESKKRPIQRIPWKTEYCTLLYIHFHKYESCKYVYIYVAVTYKRITPLQRGCCGTTTQRSNLSSTLNLLQQSRGNVESKNIMSRKRKKPGAGAYVHSLCFAFIFCTIILPTVM